jgi:hypothetical protein
MKINRLSSLLALVCASALITGCEPKKTEPAPGNSVNDTTKSVVDAAKPVVDEAVKTVTDTANAAVADVSAKANGLIDQAKALVSQSKYTEALNTLQQLGGLKLTPEQEKVVAGLKEQIQKAMAAATGTSTNVTGALNQLLKK